MGRNRRPAGLSLSLSQSTCAPGGFGEGGGAWGVSTFGLLGAMISHLPSPTAPIQFLLLPRARGLQRSQLSL